MSTGGIIAKPSRKAAHWKVAWTDERCDWRHCSPETLSPKSILDSA